MLGRPARTPGAEKLAFSRAIALLVAGRDGRDGCRRNLQLQVIVCQ